jgi:hypothetical protein
MNVDEPSAWAKVIRVADILLHSHSKSVATSEPRLAIQSAARNVILCDAPVERYSKSTPVYAPRSPAEDEGWRPIDVLYGSYNPRTRSIEIYVDNIVRDAAQYGEYADVLQIVRLHEYAHAIVHLGVRLDQIAAVLGSIGKAGVTDWDAFVENRTRAYEAIDIASHEFLAQAITIAWIASLPDESHRQRLRATFEALEKKQPPEYVVSDDLKHIVLQAVDWSLLVAAARRDIDVFRGDGLSLRRGLAALVREMGIRQDSSSFEAALTITLGHETESGSPAAPLVEHLAVLKDALRRSIADARADDSSALVSRAEQIRVLRQQLDIFGSFLGTLSECIRTELQKSERELVEHINAGFKEQD